MNSSLWVVIVIVVVFAAWYAWRYYKLRRDMDEYASSVRGHEFSTNIKELENLSSTITSLISTFNVQNSILDSERSRLATVLDQITDGVLIADAVGLIQFANPAAGRLFQFGNPLNHSIAEVVRNHQLVEAWRRCQQTRQMQSESVEVPARHQYLQLIPINMAVFYWFRISRISPGNRTQGFCQQSLARASHAACVAESISRNPSGGRTGRPACRAAICGPDPDRGGCAHPDGE
jgi:PAS domain-containing protein